MLNRALARASARPFAVDGEKLPLIFGHPLRLAECQVGGSLNPHCKVGKTLGALGANDQTMSFRTNRYRIKGWPQKKGAQPLRVVGRQKRVFFARVPGGKPARANHIFG